MTKAIATLALLCLLSLPALARPIILTSQDPSPPTTQCDQFDGAGQLRVRSCYLPAYGATPQDTPPFTWAHHGAFPPISVTLTAPTQVEIIYKQIVFLNSTLPNGCFPTLPSCAAYLNAIGVGGTAARDVCGGGGDGGAIAGGQGVGILGAQGFDVPFASGTTVEAICIITLPAGTTAIYAMEAARNGVFAFMGPGEQLLMVKYDDGM